jgi:hypothetical protein
MQAGRGPQTAKPPVMENRRLCLSPYAPSSSAAQNGIGRGCRTGVATAGAAHFVPSDLARTGDAPVQQRKHTPACICLQRLFWPVARGAKRKALGTTWGTLPRAALGVCAWGRAVLLVVSDQGGASGEGAQGRAHLAVYVRRSPRASATLSVTGRLPDKIALTRVRSIPWRRAKAV